MELIKCGGCGAAWFPHERASDFCTCGVECCNECGWPNKYPSRCMCPIVLSEKDSEMVRKLLDKGSAL